LRGDESNLGKLYFLFFLPRVSEKIYCVSTFPFVDVLFFLGFFALLRDSEREFGVADIQLSLTALEVVFLNVGKIGPL